MRVCIWLQPLLVVGISTITKALAETCSETCELESSNVLSGQGKALLQISKTAPSGVPGPGLPTVAPPPAAGRGRAVVLPKAGPPAPPVGVHAGVGAVPGGVAPGAVAFPPAPPMLMPMGVPALPLLGIVAGIDGADSKPSAKYPPNTLTACSDKHGASSCLSGSDAPLDEVGYQMIAKKCCHHEMSQFARREIARQQFKICDLSGLHGFVHWYDCLDDKRSFAVMREEISKAHAIECPWLGKIGNDCPTKGFNCEQEFSPCPETAPELSLQGSVAPLTQKGYAAVRLRCCHTEMEHFMLREIHRQNLYVCDKGSFKGMLHWYDCMDDGPQQTYEKMVKEIAFARSGAHCPWLGKKGEGCPALGPNCGQNEPQDATAHRRRTACAKNGDCNMAKK